MQFKPLDWKNKIHTEARQISTIFKEIMNASKSLKSSIMIKMISRLLNSQSLSNSLTPLPIVENSTEKNDMNFLKEWLSHGKFSEKLQIGFSIFFFGNQTHNFIIH